MAAWFKHDIVDWMDGTEGLDDGAYRAYHVICQLQYLHEGPIALNESGLAGRCNQHVLRFRKNLLKLIELGKVTLIDGKLSNARVENELQRIPSKRKPQANPRPTPDTPPPHPHRVSMGSRSQAIENTHPKKQTRLDKTRQETPIGVSAAPAAPAKGSKRNPMTTIPDDFQLTASRIQVAADLNLDAHATFGRFKLHARDKNRRSAHWDSAWVTWCEKQAQWAREQPMGRGTAYAVHDDGVSPVRQARDPYGD
jgi:Protein of unknown function (DUF1376)